MTKIDEDRDEFRTRIMSSHRLIKDGDARAANVEMDAVNSLIDYWRDEGQIVTYLAPLLDESEKLYVRYNAASGLLNSGYAEQAIPTLEAVSAGRGLAAAGALLLLDSWHEQRS
jgi:hypothetical protein